MRYALACLAVIATPSLAHAQTVPDHRKLLSKSVAVWAAPLGEVDQAPAASRPGFKEWNEQLEVAKSKRTQGIRYTLLGIGMGLAGPLLAASSLDGGSVRTAGLLGLGGAGLPIYGGYRWFSASQEIEDLDREGRVKGFLSLNGLQGPRAVAGIRIAF